MISRSMESPDYKEKIRVRAYEDNAKTVYVEFKRKLDGIVYKQRTKALYPDVLDIYHCDFTDKQIGNDSYECTAGQNSSMGSFGGGKGFKG